MSSIQSTPPEILFASLLERASGQIPAPTPANYRIPTNIYNDAERFERERQRLFRERPLPIAHVSQFPQPGAALVHDWLGLPLVTVRDKTGEIGTFMNVCRHRGMRLVQESGAADLRSFVCPYHQWTYGLDGKLRNVPLQESFADLDPGDHNLVRLPTEVRHGLVWLQATAGSEMNLEAHLAGLGTDLDTFGVGQARVFRQHNRTIACNWKLVQDAFLDGYHVVRLHKNSVGPFFPDCITMSDSLGNHIRSAVARNEIYDAIDLPSEQWDLRRHCTFSYTIFPNAVLIAHPDYTSLITLYPQSAGETLFCHTMLVPELPDTEKGRDHYHRSFELIDSGVFQAEDIFVCVGAQAGIESGANTEFLCGAHETSLQLFHERVDAALG
jgi:phenylpropionate dioxygenase-like ring-hydroxylating dioxygenase large terminal subunit